MQLDFRLDSIKFQTRDTQISASCILLCCKDATTWKSSPKYKPSLSLSCINLVSWWYEKLYFVSFTHTEKCLTSCIDSLILNTVFLCRCKKVKEL